MNHDKQYDIATGKQFFAKICPISSERVRTLHNRQIFMLLTVFIFKYNS